MLIFITVMHVLLAVFMIFVILLQPGKDAGMGAAFGGGAATSAFGGRGAVTFLSKVTAACAVLFFLSSLALSFVGMGTSVAARLPAKQAQPAATTTTPTVEQAPGDAPPPPPPAAAEAQGNQPQPLPGESPTIDPNAPPPAGLPEPPANNPPAPANP